MYAVSVHPIREKLPYAYGIDSLLTYIRTYTHTYHTVLSTAALTTYLTTYTYIHTYLYPYLRKKPESKSLGSLTRRTPVVRASKLSVVELMKSVCVCGIAFHTYLTHSSHACGKPR